MSGGERILIMTIAISIIVGILVILFHPYYTPEKILKTNKNYYPMVTEKGLDFNSDVYNGE